MTTTDTLYASNPSRERWLAFSDLGGKASPQWLRETVQNGIDACIASASGTGDVYFDVAPNLDVFGDYYEDMRDTSGWGPKAQVCDSGEGFPLSEVKPRLLGVSESGRDDGEHMGIGIKDSAYAGNTLGLIFVTRREGETYVSRIRWHEAEETFGLVETPYGSVAPVEPGVFDYLVSDIRTSRRSQGLPGFAEEHGTAVIMLGDSPAEDTTAPPAQAGVVGAEWAVQWLNRRYARLPAGVGVYAREVRSTRKERSFKSFLNVTGMGEHLDANCEASGVLSLPDARCHWWIVTEKLTGTTGRHPRSGHVAVMWPDRHHQELYNFIPSHRGGVAVLQKFGCGVGAGRMVIYIELKPDPSTYKASRSRREIIPQSAHGEEGALPLEDWQAQFVDRLPQSIEEFVQSLANEALDLDDREKLEKLLNDRWEILQPARKNRKPRGPRGDLDEQRDELADLYMLDENGKHVVGPLDSPGGRPRDLGGTHEPPDAEPEERTREDYGLDGEPNQRASTIDPDGKTAKKTGKKLEPNEHIEAPAFYFCSADPEHPLYQPSSPRPDGDLEGQAARYTPIPSEPGEVYINLDWGEFDMLQRYCVRQAGLRNYPSVRRHAWIVMMQGFKAKLSQVIIKRSHDKNNPGSGNALNEHVLTGVCSDVFDVSDSVIKNLKKAFRAQAKK